LDVSLLIEEQGCFYKEVNHECFNCESSERNRPYLNFQHFANFAKNLTTRNCTNQSHLAFRM